MEPALNRTLKRKLAHKLDLPPAILLDQATIHLIGDGELKLINHKGLIQYSDTCIRAKSSQGVVEIVGGELEIICFSANEMKISGKIRQVMLK